MLMPVLSPVLLLLTGPAGAGKTTIADKWAHMQLRPTAHLSVDNVRRFVKAGYVNSADSWTPDHPIQTKFARDACAELGRRYLQGGYSCIIDDAIFPASPKIGYAEWQGSLGDTPHQLVVIMPSLEAVLDRNRQRSAQQQLAPERIATIHTMMLPWREQQFPVIDNTYLSAEETARLIQQFVTGT